MDKILIERLSDEKRKALKIPDAPQNFSGWSVWECAPSSFDWRYSEAEEAFVYQGKVKVRTNNGEVEINSGDFVTFPKNLSCHWEVIATVKKVYRFK